MKEYIKKFESLNDADNHVIDNPFTSYIVGQGNLVCGEPNKKLKLEGGSIVIANAGPILISFTIGGTTYQTEEGMSWDEWLESNYNTDGYCYAGPKGWFGIYNNDVTMGVTYAEDILPAIQGGEINNGDIYYLFGVDSLSDM